MKSSLVSIIDKSDKVDIKKLKNNNPKYLILHSTKNYSKYEDLLKFHKYEMGWETIGYHFFIEKSGKIIQTRPLYKEGAHTLGFNFDSIGLCIYSKDGNLTKNKIMITKNLIKKLMGDFKNNLNLISHTQAQIIYNNKLLEKYKFDIKFENNLNVNKKIIFEKLNEKMIKLAGQLDSEKYFKLKESLKSFKNCPGEMFYIFNEK